MISSTRFVKCEKRKTRKFDLSSLTTSGRQTAHSPSHSFVYVSRVRFTRRCGGVFAAETPKTKFPTTSFHATYIAITAQPDVVNLKAEVNPDLKLVSDPDL